MFKKKSALWSLLLAICILCTACSAAETSNAATDTPAPQPTEGAFLLPDDIRVDASGVPMLRVYVQEQKEIEEMDIERYLCGVLAGEMKNDWPMEALRAQAILARTFVIRFITEKQSMYAGADISTDIKEAQAYDADGVNDRIREAVNSTRGQIVCYGGEPIYAWFHAHAGGRTATAAEGLSYEKDAPYTQSVVSEESGDAPQEDADWRVEFDQKEVLSAAAEAGVRLGDAVESVTAGPTGESGRLKTIVINGKEVPANEFRVAIGSAKMKSTLITALAYANGTLTIAGKGYGHGVGMSQWGAYAMAKNGKNAQEIIQTYFDKVDIVQIWQ